MKQTIATLLSGIVQGLKFKFVLIFILLGGVISLLMYLPYNWYIKESYTMTIIT
jgi:hypothetical protein